METAVKDEAGKSASRQFAGEHDAPSSEDNGTSKSSSNGESQDKRQTRIRGNEAQIAFMVEFMSKHREMAQYEASKAPPSRQRHRAEWGALTRRINTLGPKKTTAQWKKAWRAQRQRATRVRAQLGRDPAALALHASDTCRQILDILRDGGADAGNSVDANVRQVVEIVKCETRNAIKCESPATDARNTTSAPPGECGCAAARDHTPVVSWNWDPLGAPPSPAASSDTPLTAHSCKCNTAGIEQALRRMEDAQSSLVQAAQRQAHLLEKLLEQSSQQARQRLAAEAQQSALQERVVALQERLVSLAEAGLYRPPPAPAPPPRYHNHAS